MVRFQEVGRCGSHNSPVCSLPLPLTFSQASRKNRGLGLWGPDPVRESDGECLQVNGKEKTLGEKKNKFLL